MALGHALLPDDPMASRVRSHLRRRDNLRADRLQVRQRIANLRTAPMGSLRSLAGAPQAADAARRRARAATCLTHAGWRARDALTIFMGLRLALPAVLGLAAFVFVMPRTWR